MSRLSEPQDPDFQRLNASIDFDRRLWPQDLAQSRAHARMLAARGIIGEEDLGRLLEGLEAVEGELSGGDFPFAPDDEDIHMAIERRLTEIVGPVGGRAAHRPLAQRPGRDRPDAVHARASGHRGRTPRLADEHAARAGRGARRLGDARLHPPAAGPARVPGRTTCWRTSGCSTATASGSPSPSTSAGGLPLGSGALAGVNFDTDRRQVAAELGFSIVAENSLDAVSGRDFALDYLGAAATCATHLSRLGAELVLWSSSEFGFVELSDSWSSSSSLMPQKKNPDAAELLRAKAPRVVAHLSALHGVIHALPLAYNRICRRTRSTCSTPPTRSSCASRRPGGCWRNPAAAPSRSPLACRALPRL